jgi:hypothetical protein
VMRGTALAPGWSPSRGPVTSRVPHEGRRVKYHRRSEAKQAPDSRLGEAMHEAVAEEAVRIRILVTGAGHSVANSSAEQRQHHTESEASERGADLTMSKVDDRCPRKMPPVARYASAGVPLGHAIAKNP